MQAAQMVTSSVRPKQNLALLIEAAFSRYEGWVVKAGIVERAVPRTSLPPFAPGYVVAILAVGISGFSGCTKDALSGVGRAYVPGHCWPRQHRKKHRGSANHSEFRHAFLPLVLAAIKVSARVPLLFPKR